MGRPGSGGDVDLFAVDDVVISIEYRRRGYRRGIGPEGRFGDGHRRPHTPQPGDLFVGGDPEMAALPKP